MLKLLVIGILLSAFQHAASAPTIRAAAREISLHNAQTYTLVLNSQLFTIAKNSTHLFVDSTDPNVKRCAMDVEEHTIQKRVEATTVGRKIIVWGVRAKYHTDIGDRIDHTVLIVDPYQCSFKVASTFEEERQGSSWWSESMAKVVAYDDSFDVFYPSLQTCAPCRYSIDGKRIDLQHQLKANRTFDGNYEFFRIQSYNEPGRANRYFYAHTFRVNSSVIKILDENFRVLKQRSLEHKVNGIAADPHTSSNIHVCYITGDPWSWESTNNSIHCEQFDADLQLLYIIRLPTLKEHEPLSLAMTADASGGVVVAVTQSASRHRSGGEKFSYYRMNSQGRIIDCPTVHQVSENSFGAWSIRGFLANNMYCLENINSDRYQNYENDFVKCFAISQ